MNFSMKTLSSLWFKNRGSNDYEWVRRAYIKAPRITGSNEYILVYEGLNSVAITGTLAYGETLTANVTPSYSPIQVYQWYRGENAISGATGQTYVITAQDIGYQLKVRATVAEGVYEDSNYTGVINLTSVSISGSTQIGNVLTATPTPTGGDSYTYQWYRNDVAISGETGYTHTLVSADAGKSIKCRVYTRNTNYYRDSSAVSITGINSVTVSGTTRVGNTLTATVSPSGISGVAYQWYRGNSPITGATGSTYTLQSADRTYQIKCRASIGSYYVDSSYTSSVIGWVYHTGEIVLSNEVTYYFGATIRNPTLVFAVSVACNNGGSDYNLQAGVQCGAIGLNYNNAGWNTTSYSISGTFTATNNAEITSINVKAFASAWRNSGSGGSLNERVTSYSLKITSWYTLE